MDNYSIILEGKPEYEGWAKTQDGWIGYWNKADDEKAFAVSIMAIKRKNG